ncbi:MAG: hypothetical protein ABSH08_02230 [Tepidisphaeraceae bacterium]|jgi:hypothetical protein
MAEELPLNLGVARRLRAPELRLLQRLVQQAVGYSLRLDVTLPMLEVREMPDGGMGSLYIVNPEKNPMDRRFGRRIAEAQFDDADGVKVIASLNVDQDNNLFELDIWKVDFRPLIRLPDE